MLAAAAGGAAYEKAAIHREHIVRPPTEMPVHLPDGTFETIDLDETTTAADVASEVARRVGLSTSLPFFALVERITGAPFGSGDLRLLPEDEILQKTVLGWLNGTSSAY